MQPLTLTARRRFGFSHDPFRAEMQSVDDVLMTQEHQNCYDEMMRAAKRQDFIAIIGDVGCGKSTIRQTFLQRLPSSMHVIQIQSLDKSTLTAGNLYDAILLDLGAALDKKMTLPVKRESKARKVIATLEALIDDNGSAVLIVEEAQDLPKELFRALKRLHELDRAFKRLLSIQLIGMLSLHQHLNDPNIREVGNRVSRFEFRGLGKKYAEYCRHKIEAAFDAAGKHRKMEDIIDPEALKAIYDCCIKTQGSGRNKAVYGPYPLQLNTMLTLAFNTADQLGHSRVSVEDIEDIKLLQETR